MLEHNNRFTVKDSIQLSLPDEWQGGVINSKISENEHLSGSAFQLAKNNHWKKIAIVSMDLQATDGIRWVISQLSSIHLRTFRTPQEFEDENTSPQGFHPDIVIWVERKNDGTQNLVDNIFRLCSRMPNTEQVILSDNLPIGMFETGSLINQISIIDLCSPIELVSSMINNKICNSIQNNRGDLVSRSIITASQWKVLRLFSKGLSTSQVSSILKVSKKTVLSHKLSAMKRLGISTRPAEAWLLRCVQSFMLHIMKHNHSAKMYS